MARRKSSQPDFDPVLSRGIIAIILVVAAIVITLSFFDAAGPLGYILNTGILAFLFGHIRFATPFVIILIAYFLFKDQEYDYRPTHGIGAVIFLFSFAGLFHVPFAAEDMWNQAVLGNGGGAFGMFAFPLKMYMGGIAAVIILIGLVIVSLLLMFNTIIVNFIMEHRKDFKGSVGTGLVSVIKALFVRDSEEYDEDEEEEYDDEEEYEDEDEYEDEEDEEEDDERFVTKRVKGDRSDRSSKAKSVDDSDEEESEKSSTSSAWDHKVIVRDLPPLSLLSSKKGKPTSGDIKSNKQIINDTLNEFGIEVDMGDVRIGPTVTQFTLKPKKGVKLSRITSLNNDLALALAAHPIRIEAPIPGKSLVGIEVPNQKAAMVTFKELLEDKVFGDREHNMMIALGKDVAGKTWFGNLPRMPHLLIAGATGSGKTVCVNTILMSLLYQNSAETLRMIMVDPKRVELTLYNGIPHLMTPVITKTKETVNALKWTISEMERRFEVLSKIGSRDITSYNKKHPDNKLPHLVFVIDELADLMATASNDVEAGIIRLAQMARAVGIHLILATQRPSVDVITGLMKANIPGRIAFSVASIVDSRTILDGPGAEKLMGRGDMLYQTAELSKPVRIQGAFISEIELKRVVDHLKGDEAPEYDASIVEKQKGGTMNMFGGSDDDVDDLFMDAKQAVLEAGKASASFLQRKLKIGYARAARILDELEAAGIIGPADGAKPREILVTSMDDTGTMDMGGDLNVYDEEDEEDEAENDRSDRMSEANSVDESDEEEEEYDDEEEDEEDNDEEDYDEDEIEEDEYEYEEEEDEELDDEEDQDEYEDDAEDEEYDDEEYEDEDEEDKN